MDLARFFPFLSQISGIKLNEGLFFIRKNLLKKPFDWLRKVDFRNAYTRICFWQKRISNFIKKRRTIKLLHILRNYSALSVVMSSVVLVSSTNLAAGKGSSGFLFGYLEDSSGDEIRVNLSQPGAVRKNDLAFVLLMKASSYPEPDYKESEYPEKNSLISEQGLLTASNVALRDPEEEGGVEIYKVEEGDTISSIAAKNKITVNTILWANDIENPDSIKPGDKIFILPVAGVSYTVKKGDTLDGIAKKYKADKDKIIAFNDLKADGQITEGDQIIIPGGEKETQDRSVAASGVIQRRQYATPQGGDPLISGWKKLEGKAGAGHRFPYGYCTWYVAQRRYVPWGGNAGTWLYNAKVWGYKTGKTPQVGAIIVTSESWWGHNGIVEKVGGGSVTISEMNYKGWGKVDRRTLDAGSRVIKGYIY